MFCLDFQYVHQTLDNLGHPAVHHAQSNSPLNSPFLNLKPFMPMTTHLQTILSRVS